MSSDSEEDNALPLLQQGDAASEVLAPLAPAAQFPALKTIWEDQYCQQCQVGNDKGWECLRCGRQFKPVHHTRAIAHYAKIPNQGVKVCTSVIPDHEFQRYINLWNRTKKRKTELTMVRMTITEDKEDKLASSTDRLLEARNKKPKVSTEMRRYYDTVGGSKSNHLPSGQTPIDTAFDTLKQSDLARMNDARMHMAIATFFHENNLPDRAVNSSSFKIMIKYARMVGTSYKPPDRLDIGGTLLDINHKNIVENNKEVLCREADIFGLTWLSDGATIARMPLINILGLCADTPPTCVGIEDCSGHMSQGGKKDAVYIASLLEEVVLPYDPDRLRTTIFWFDGAGNVQKAGRILEVLFPRAYSLHGGEHVISLFFSDIAKLQQIKVSLIFVFFIFEINLIKLYSISDTYSEVLQALQHIWIRCHPRDICPIHGSVSCLQQWQEDWAFAWGKYPFCNMVLCHDANFEVEGCSAVYCASGSFQGLSKDRCDSCHDNGYYKSKVLQGTICLAPCCVPGY